MLIAKIIKKEKRSERTMGLFFTETEVLHRWGTETRKSGIGQKLIKVLPLRWKDYRANLSEFSPSLKTFVSPLLESSDE